MSFDENGRDLAYQAERLAADKRDGRRRLARELAWYAFIVGCVVGGFIAGGMAARWTLP